MDLSNKARHLIKEQLTEWDLARKNYGGLKNFKTKSFDFWHYHIDVQFNPERIVSSAAKVDAKSIGDRPCFLCQKNLPSQQHGLPIDDRFIALVNPFPIFPEHLTIPNLDHTDQRIFENFGPMLDLAASLHEFVVFYNGPKCGASAPDHLHFQATKKGSLPIEKDYLNDNCCRTVLCTGGLTISYWPDYQRGIFTLSSKYKGQLIDSFYQVYRKLQTAQPYGEEPMMNILISFGQDGWVAHVVPRKLHRPTAYFETDEKQILISPASVDMGGVLIAPREEDFMKITKEDIKGIFGQVCYNARTVLKMIYEL